MEVEFLSNVRYDLFVTPTELSQWNQKLLEIRRYLNWQTSVQPPASSEQVPDGEPQLGETSLIDAKYRPIRVLNTLLYPPTRRSLCQNRQVRQTQHTQPQSKSIAMTWRLLAMVPTQSSGPESNPGSR
ncbi:hypothetical protein N7478_007381 [Penicillium angulare]|uniref:uncharacterized protein n=1 Tax=Penicillium angulare TaxID=116970 RepID=UPI0025420C2F|nr:uncharacterized protein N7478_007381 [Penicillium angulare]KAJ5282009.1 hypothetical protein N7478_007381 [Penicillium angulare]